MTPAQSQWWQNGVIYQIYPRSFKDSNADGVGDLQGIISRLDYLTWLGVDAIWISPIFPSPMADFGYDIADYCNIDPIFGDMVTFDTLLQEAHRRDLKVLLDFVPNHTSDEHPWFIESRTSHTSSKRDWYIWRDPAPDGGPPNNWESHFGGPAWTFDPHTGQYYLHQFDTKQPELNWRNPDVQAAMYDIMRFWLDRGVDGFRVDVLWLLIKDEQLRNNPINPNWQEGDLSSAHYIQLYNHDQPETLEIVSAMRAITESYGGRVLIGEIYLPVDRLMRYYGEDLNGAHLPFNFQLVELSTWNASMLKQVIESYEAALPAGAWPNWVLSNHDRPRITTRVGLPSARIASMLLLTLRGTPTCYYGDELAMQDVSIPTSMIHDPRGKRLPALGRDPARTPMQWDATPNAGFCPPGVQPWLPLAADYQQVNVAIEEADPHSHLSLTRALLALRRDKPALHTGSYQTLKNSSESCLVYLRQHGHQRLLVALNFTGEIQEIKLIEGGKGHILLSTLLDREEQVNLEAFSLWGYEGCIIEITE